MIDNMELNNKTFFEALENMKKSLLKKSKKYEFFVPYLSYYPPLRLKYRKWGDLEKYHKKVKPQRNLENLLI